VAAFAQGGSPMLTDDTSTTEARHWELIVAYTDQRTHSGVQQEQFPLVEIDYGLTERVQLAYTIGWAVDDAPGEDRRSALGNSQFAVKWRFYDHPANGFSMSVGPQLQLHEFSTPNRNAVDSSTTFVLPVEIQGKLGWLDWGVEVGRNFISGNEDTWFYGVVIGHNFYDRFELAAELFTTAQGSIDHDVLATANVGVRWHLTPHHTLLMAVGRGVNRLRGDELDFTGYLGLDVTF